MKHKGGVLHLHSIKTRRVTQVVLHLFDLPIDRGEWSTHIPAAFHLEERTCYTKRLGRSVSLRTGMDVSEHKNVVHLPARSPDLPLGSLFNN